MLALDKASLTSSIKAEAHRLGFDLVGITSPEPPRHLDVYRRWIAQGCHGGMAYLATERALDRRADPRLTLPECESILVLGFNYLPQAPSAKPESGYAQIAAYARGEDYHDVLVQRLEALVNTIEEMLQAPVPNRIYTDTGPILERELAQRAGLGWIGKNTCLINPEIGSHILLAEVFLGISLQVDAPFFDDRCGTCTRCIDACPTSCIRHDRTIDARQCISYLTIEEKAAIPSPLRPAVGDWLFGCDICQQVCPWNSRFAKPTRDPSFQPRQFLAEPDPKPFLALTPEGWRDPLLGSPLLRSKRRGLIRNAVIVAANTGDIAAIPQIAHLLECDEESLIRAHAAWALGQMDDERSKVSLANAREVEKDPEVKAEIEAALAKLNPDSS
jgi:epoxyqueuosine reductase